MASKTEPTIITDENEFFKTIKESLIILSTSSLDKIDDYGRLFGSLGIEDSAKPQEIGINAYFSDIGRFGDVATKTDEATQTYTGNAKQKAMQQLRFLQKNGDTIRGKLAPKASQELIDAKKECNKFDPSTVSITGMTEDSGWQIVLKGATEQQKKDFIAQIKKDILPLIRKQDSWIIDKIHIPEKPGDPDETGFPGPNLKPIQEHIGGFPKLMDIIYSAADSVGIKDLDYRSVVTASFVFPKQNKMFTKTFVSKGRLLTSREYDEGIVHNLKRKDVINADFVQIPDGQQSKPLNTSQLYDNGILAKSSGELPADLPRRALAEWLQQSIGKGTVTGYEKSRQVKIGFVTPEGNNTPQITIPQGVEVGNVPTDAQLLNNPQAELLGDVDAVVLVPGQNPYVENNSLYDDPNYVFLLKFVVAREAAEPHSKYKHLLVDNRSGKFSKALNMIRNHYMTGRSIGEPPFLVATTNDEFNHYLDEIHNEVRRAPRVIKTENPHPEATPEMQFIPDDGKFTLFIGGGHSNNNKRDREDAFNLGYLCAKNDWRIVTGAGSIEGSMGSVHTGFIQYHLDKLFQQERPEAAQFMSQLDHLKDPKTGKARSYKKVVDGKTMYDAEALIIDHPEIINAMADNDPPLIPRNMFYGYSFENVLKLESLTGKPPPGITYSDAKNMPRRLAALLTPGTKVIMSGSVGTDQEVVEAINQHLKALAPDYKGRMFKDGTPNSNGMLIVYNVNGQYNQLLSRYNLLGPELVPIKKRKMYNIVVVDNYKDLTTALLGDGHSPGRAASFKNERSAASR